MTYAAARDANPAFSVFADRRRDTRWTHVHVHVLNNGTYKLPAMPLNLTPFVVLVVECVLAPHMSLAE